MMRWALSSLTNLITSVYSSLSQDYGYTVDVYRYVSNTVDLSTGEQIREAVKRTARNVLVFDARELVERVNDLGLFTAKDRVFVIPKRYATDPYNKNCWLVFSGTCYEINSVTEHGDTDTYVIKATAVRGKGFVQIFERIVSDLLYIYDSVAVDKGDSGSQDLSVSDSHVVLLVHGQVYSEGYMDNITVAQSAAGQLLNPSFRPYTFRPSMIGRPYGFTLATVDL